MKYYPLFWDIETTGFNPMQQEYWDSADQDAQVIAVAIGHITNVHDAAGVEDAEYESRVIMDDSEYQTIKAAFRHAKEVVSEIEEWKEGSEHLDEAPWTKEAFVVGWNSRYFDHQYYAARASRKRLNPWPFGYRRKRLDLMRPGSKAMDQFKASQDDFATWNNIEYNDTIDGADMPDAWKNGDTNMVWEHAKDDIEVLMKCFMAVRSEAYNHLYRHYEDINKSEYVATDEVNI